MNDHLRIDPTTRSPEPDPDTGGLLRVPADLPIDELVALTTDPGAVIVEGLLDPALVARVNAEIDDWLARHPGDGAPSSGNELYDLFLGAGTVRLHGLLTKLPSSGRDLIAAGPIVRWAERLLARSAPSILLSADEVIQIGPGEPAQYLHRDSDSWPALPPGGDPFIVNAIVALGEVTAANGGTVIAPGSHRWTPGRRPLTHEVAVAAMHPGDALLFRGDLVHGGGANTTDRPRRAVSLSYCSGWLRPVENHLAHLGVPTVLASDPTVRGLLGAGVHDATSRGGGLLGLVDGRAPEATGG